MRNSFCVDVKVRNTNQNPLVLLDQARRLLDLQGRNGIIAKRGQTNVRYGKAGHLRFPFADKASAIRFQSTVEEYCSPAVRTRLRSKMD